MSNEFERSDVVFIQQGSSNTLRVENENKWYVVREEWEGSRLLNTFVLSSYETEAAANQAMDIYKAASALGRKGGHANTDLQNKARAKNGALSGGRPPKDKSAI